MDGASWEGYAIEEVLKAVEPDEAFYWATHNGAELYLPLLKDGRASVSSANGWTPRA